MVIVQFIAAVRTLIRKGPELIPTGVYNNDLPFVAAIKVDG
jgi:hypothetical protein